MTMNDPKGLDTSVTIISRNSKSEGRQHMMNRLLLTAVGMLSGMTAYESLKQLLFPSITIWQSHIITICFSVFIATLVTYLVSRKSDLLLAQISEENMRRKESEDALRLSEDKFSKLFHSNPDWVIISSLHEGRYIDVNDAFLRMTGYNREEVIGHTSLELNIWVEPEERKAMIPILLKDGRISNHDVRFRIKSGQIRFMLRSAALIDFGGEAAIISVSKDITERMRAETEKKALQAQLLQAQKMESVGTLAGGVAHDFNNLLTSILGHTDLAMMHSSSPSERIHADLKAIERSALRAAELIRQLLAFARRQTIAPEVVDLNDRVSGVLEMLQRLIGKYIHLVWKPGDCLWPVKFDPSQIDQLLEILCVNARDSISAVGKVTIETKNTTLDDAYCAVNQGFISGEYVMLTVSDDGSGMSKEVLDRIYEPFFTTKEVGKGTGLGLATVYGIVKQNDGFMYVSSEPGNGSTFKVCLPRVMGEAIGPSSKSTEKTR